MTEYRPTVAVHVVWHPRCEAAGEYARALFAHLFEEPGDLASHGLRIPVRLWRSQPDVAEPPKPEVPPLAEARKAALVILVDENFITADGWQAFLDEAHAAARRDDDHVLMVTLTRDAMSLRTRLLARNAIRAHEVDESLRKVWLLNRVTHALCRLITGTRARVFLSHAKADGLALTEEVRRFLESGTGVQNFFDAQDLPEGSRWKDLLRGAAADNLLLAIRTDAYATREWCRIEVLDAKRAGSPVIVLDALDSFEPRGFPYLGNGPAVRWRGGDSAAGMEALLRVVLHEALRYRHFPARVADLCNAYRVRDSPRVLAAPPELLTVLRAREPTSDGSRRLIYPDPPLGTDELRLVEELAPELEPLTPNELIARQ
jgi:hypothetical protein